VAKFTRMGVHSERRKADNISLFYTYRETFWKVPSFFLILTFHCSRIEIEKQEKPFSASKYTAWSVGGLWGEGGEMKGQATL